MRTEEVRIFEFNELESEAAKNRAREWLRDFERRDFDPLDNCREDFETICTILGITLDRHGNAGETSIWYSGFWSQGDGASFEGHYEYAKDAPLKIREHAPIDESLHKIADELEAFQQQNGCHLIAAINRIPSSRHSHENSVSVDVYHESYDQDVIEEHNPIRSALRDLMRWMYRSLESEYEYHMSDACIDDMLICNEYEFTADGTHWGVA